MSRLASLFNRRLGLALAWAAALVGIAAALNVAGIRVVGSIDGWTHWLRAHAGYFLAWRLCLYAATAYGWWWMRRRLRQYEPDSEAHQRLRRTEIAAVAALVLLEASQWLQHG